jgi:hypothetical protein
MPPGNNLGSEPFTRKRLPAFRAGQNYRDDPATDRGGNNPQAISPIACFCKVRVLERCM